MKKVPLMAILLIMLFCFSCSTGRGLYTFDQKDPLPETEAGYEGDDEQIQEKAEESGSSLSSGLDNLRHNEYEAAARDFKKTLSSDPGNVEAYYYLGLANQNMERWSDAIEGYRAALRFNPDFFEANFNLAAIYSILEKYDLAADYFQKALKTSPDDAELHYNMALCFDQMGKGNEAVDEYQKSLQLDPQMKEGYLHLAELFEQQERMPEALAEYQKLLKIDPQNKEAKNRIKAILAQEEKIEKEKKAQQVQLKAEKMAKTQPPLKPKASDGALPKAEGEKEEGNFKKFLKLPQTTWAKFTSWTKKSYHPKDGTLREEPAASTYKSKGFSDDLRLSLNNKLVIQKEVAFENDEDSTLDSRRMITTIGYAPEFLNIFSFKDTQIYFNLGALSMDIDKTGTQFEPIDKAMALAYGAGFSSNLYTLPQYPVSLMFGLDILHYAPEIEAADNEGQESVASMDLTEYQVAADTMYLGFSKFTPYVGLLYAKTAGSFELTEETTSTKLDFNEKSNLGCRLGTTYNWQKNISVAGEYRLLDESALSLLVRYSF